MIEVALQTESSSLASLVNVIAIGILMLYVYYHAEYRRATEDDVKRRTRRRATASILGFAFFAVVVASYGPPGTWVGPIGESVESYFQRLATGLFTIGEDSVSRDSSDPILEFLKSIGLIAYIGLFAALSISNGVVKKVGQTISNIF